ncbi:glycerol kinase [Caerostris darwini]|uniref:Glycerol kinase n=1 Tax=Caerostris darwini TaxID=1538125 RepID=A0AAV4R132_9ARAC|nr:glycerol kinase [Caerostris darwini]
MSSLIGLKAQTSKEHIVRAILESLAFQVRLLLDTVENHYGTDTEMFRACGGIAKNDFILQLVSDLSRKIIKRLKHNECSSLGAAYFAGLYCGIWKNINEIKAIQAKGDTFIPKFPSATKYEMQYLNWKKAVYHPIVTANSV